MPYHGEADVLNRDLVKLTPAELVAHLDAVIDIAAGFGDPVWVVGLSAGATMAGWAAATRSEVSRLVLAAPLVAPVGFPLPLVRAVREVPPDRAPALLVVGPAGEGEASRAARTPTPASRCPGIMTFLHLSEWLYDHSVRLGHDLERVVLVTNPGDFAIRQGRGAGVRAHASSATRPTTSARRTIDADLKWMHDFVDPLSPATGTTEQVVAILLGSPRRR